MASNFLLFIFAAAPFILFWNGFAESVAGGENLRQQPINSSNCFLYLDIQSSAILSDPIGGEAHIVIHAQFEY